MNTPTLISRQQLEILNRRTLQYPLHIAEKDYFLAFVMQVISLSSLKDTLIFKGGAALHHCFLNQYRFSEDLDFSTNQTSIKIEDIRSALQTIAHLKIQKEYISSATIKIEKLQYTGPLIQPNSIKVEIDFMQNVVLPPRKVLYQNVWGFDFKVNIMDIREICAEKIRAMSERVRYRDFYDYSMIMKKLSVHIPEVLQLVRQKERRSAISPANILNNWRLARADKHNEYQTIRFSEQIPDDEVENYLAMLKFKPMAKSQ